MKIEKRDFLQGLKAGFPIAVGYIPIAIAFSILAKNSGVPNYVSMLMSFVVFAGASQFIGINLINLGASPYEIILTTFILNLRHFLMSASLSQRLDSGISRGFKAFVAFGVTDESFTVASLQKENKLAKYFVLGVNLIGFSAWNIGTWIGLFFAPTIPLLLKNSLGIALYAMFIGLLIPGIKKDKIAFKVAILAMIINSIISYVPILSFISNGWSIIIATVISAFLGVIITKSREKIKWI